MVGSPLRKAGWTCVFRLCPRKDAGCDGHPGARGLGCRRSAPSLWPP